MPLIDLQCHYGVTPQAMAVRPPELAQASAYADRFGIELLCFSSREAASDMDGGNAQLMEMLKVDKRFRAWVTLSPHQPDQSQTLARFYLVKPLWIGARFEQNNDADAINSAGGIAVLNNLRRYSRPILVTASTPATLAAAISVAKGFPNMRFVLSPQSEALTASSVAAIKDTVNMSLLPSVAFTERGVVEQAIATLGERRVLWGSDWGAYQPSSALGMVKDSALSPAQRDRMIYRNAKELMTQ